MSIQKYPFDRTAASITNRVTNEQWNLTNQTLKIIQPTAGLFYTNNLHVVKLSTSTTLVKGVDFKLIGPDSSITSRTGFETASGIALNDTSATGIYSISYNCVGGVEGSLNAMFKQLEHKIENLTSSSADFFEIINRPEEYPAIDHLHELKDLTGLNGIDLSLESILYSLRARRVPTLAAVNINNDIRKLHLLLAMVQHRVNNLSPVLIDDISTLTNDVYDTNLLLADLNQTIQSLPPTIGKKSISIPLNATNYFGTPTAEWDQVSGVWTFSQNNSNEFKFKMFIPNHWDVGNISCKLLVEKSNTTTGSVIFGISATDLSGNFNFNNETIISISSANAGIITLSAEEEIVITNSPNKESILAFKLVRKDDSCASEVKLHGIVIYYNSDSNVDS